MIDHRHNIGIDTNYMKFRCFEGEECRKIFNYGDVPGLLERQYGYEIGLERWRRLRHLLEKLKLYQADGHDFGGMPFVIEQIG